MFAAVADQVALPVAVEIEPPRHAPARNGALPDRRVDRFAAPRDIVRKTDVNRQQPPNGRFLLARSGGDSRHEHGTDFTRSTGLDAHGYIRVRHIDLVLTQTRRRYRNMSVLSETRT